MMLVGHVLDHVSDHMLDHVPDHVLDQMIIGLVATALQQLFKVPSNCNFSEHRISVMSSRDPSHDFFCSRWTSSLDQPNRVVSNRLAVYNSKSFKLNGSASPFRTKLSYIQKVPVRAHTQAARWINPPLVAVFAKIFTMAKTSLLVGPSPRVATVAPLLLPQHMFLLPLLHLLLLCLLLLAPPTFP